MEVATAAKAPSSRLARSLAAAAPCYNKGVSVFFAALVAGALVSACWMSVSARVSKVPCNTYLIFSFFLSSMSHLLFCALS